MTTTRALQKKIHIACRDLGLDVDARHDIQLVACGKASMSDMNTAELQLVLDHLVDRGWKGGFKPGSNGRYKAAPRADLRLTHVLWRKLGDADKLHDPSRAGLNAFVRSRFEDSWKSVPIDIDTLRDAGQISQLINALKDWCRREGVALDK